MIDSSIIRQELRAKNYNLSQVARSLDIDYALLKSEYGVHITPIIHPAEPAPDDISTLGKPGMEMFVVAIKPHDGAWSTDYHNVIQDARAKYDAGTHEMCQEKRSDGWIVQYLIPRRVPVKRVAYFRWDWRCF